MRRRWMIVVVVGAAAAWCVPVPVAGAADAAVTAATGPAIGAGSWRHAIEVPGLGALNAGGEAFVFSLSCGSAGNCAAAGEYSDGSGHRQAFVASERNGRWGKAIEVPGSGALNAGGFAFVSSVSCASAGNCSVGGGYRDGSGHSQAFVADQRNGRWGKAIEVPGSGALNADGDAFINSVSCASAGNCSAGGQYTNGFGDVQAFVADQRNGRWGKAIEVPDLGVLNLGGDAVVNGVSCASAGNCAAAGQYSDGSFHTQAFVVGERNGVWGRAIEIPGLGALNAGGFAFVNSVSCGSAGNCAAAGLYGDPATTTNQAFVADQRNGRWGKAIEVPGSGALNVGGHAFIKSVSCASAGNCTAAGGYRDGSNHSQTLVASERNGRWGKAVKIPGSSALNAGGFAFVNSVWCGSAGNCSAGGKYRDGSDHLQALVADQRNGRWGTAIKVPGSVALNLGGNAEVNAVWCSKAGNCAASGDYADGSRHLQGFVVSRT
jgi:hypothetical protein